MSPADSHPSPYGQPASAPVSNGMVALDTDGSGGRWRCRFAVMGYLTNFASLRRRVGLSRVESIMGDIIARIAPAARDARIHQTGHATMQIMFDTACFAEGQAMLLAIRTRLADPVDIDGIACDVQVVFGGVGALPSGMDDIDVVEAAEIALDTARAGGGDVLRDIADSRGDDPLALMRDLPDAIEHGQIFLQYQPKVHVRRQEVASAEALVRWQHSTRGLILPGNFIELAERCNAIGMLTLWTIRRVIEDQRAMAVDGLEFPIFINISGMLLSDAAFVRDASALIRDSGTRIGFEITETAVIRDPESAIANLKRFADIGVTLAIDDYGAGLSSLAYLKRLPASELKIDKLFVTQLTSSNRDPLIVRSTIDLAHALNMEVTAEGVETPATLALLGVMGCDMVQGYLISRPLEVEAFRRFVVEERHREMMAKPRLTFQRSEGLWQTA